MFITNAPAGTSDTDRAALSVQLQASPAARDTDRATESSHAHESLPVLDDAAPLELESTHPHPSPAVRGRVIVRAAESDHAHVSPDVRDCETCRAGASLHAHESDAVRVTGTATGARNSDATPSPVTLEDPD